MSYEKISQQEFLGRCAAFTRDSRKLVMLLVLALLLYSVLACASLLYLKRYIPGNSPVWIIGIAGYVLSIYGLLAGVGRLKDRSLARHKLCCPACSKPFDPASVLTTGRCGHCGHAVVELEDGLSSE